MTEHYTGGKIKPAPTWKELEARYYDFGVCPFCDKKQPKDHLCEVHLDNFRRNIFRSQTLSENWARLKEQPTPENVLAFTSFARERLDATIELLSRSNVSISPELAELRHFYEEGKEKGYPERPLNEKVNFHEKSTGGLLLNTGESKTLETAISDINNEKDMISNNITDINIEENTIKINNNLISKEIKK